MLKSLSIIMAAAALGVTTAAHAQQDAGTAKQGAAAYRVCAACHSLLPGVNLSGPSLAGLWGKKAGIMEEFGRYTDGLKNSGIVWDENALNAWLADPQALVPGTTMAFRGIGNDTTRTNLIAFLREAMGEGGAGKVVERGLIPADMAEGQIPPDLSSAGKDQRIASISHCRDGYSVTTEDGAVLPFWETNVRLKIDTSKRGPKDGAPVLQRSGMVGDRVSVVFPSIEKMRAILNEKC